LFVLGLLVVHVVVGQESFMDRGVADDIGTISATPTTPVLEGVRAAARVTPVEQFEEADIPTEITHAWYINLYSQHHRSQYQTAQLKALEIPFSRKPAVTVTSLQQVIDEPVLYHAIEHMPGFAHPAFNWDKPEVILPRKQKFVLSVCLSHLTLYQAIAAAHQHDPTDHLMMILEDDVHLSANLTSLLPSLMHHVPPDFETLRLSHWGENRPQDRVNDFIFKTAPPFWIEKNDTIFYGGAHAVLVRTSTLPRLIEKLQSMLLTDFDGMLTSFPDIKSYVFDPNLHLAEVGAGGEGSSNPSKLDILDAKHKKAQLAANAMMGA